VTVTSGERRTSCHQSRVIHRRNACAPHEIEVAQRHYDAARCLFRETFQRGKIKMIVMIVGDEHKVDRRQVFKPDTGLGATPGTCPRYRAAAVRPDRVCQDVEAIQLNEEGCVTDGGYGERSFRDAGDRDGSGCKIIRLRPFGPIVAKQPAPDPAGAGRAWALCPGGMSPVAEKPGLKNAWPSKWVEAGCALSTEAPISAPRAASSNKPASAKEKNEWTQ